MNCFFKKMWLLEKFMCIHGSHYISMDSAALDNACPVHFWPLMSLCAALLLGSLPHLLSVHFAFSSQLVLTVEGRGETG